MREILCLRPLTRNLTSLLPNRHEIVIFPGEDEFRNNFKFRIPERWEVYENENQYERRFAGGAFYPKSVSTDLINTPLLQGDCTTTGDQNRFNGFPQREST